METKSRSVKVIVAALALLALIGVVFVPVFPNTSVPGDPTALPDPRVDAPISQSDLAQILTLVRGSGYVSAYRRHRTLTRLPLRSISVANPSLLVGPNQPTTKVSPPGTIQATFGNDCQPANCQEGVTYYFSKRNGNWHINKIERWVA